MELVLDTCTVRSWRPADAAPLARHADNRKIWRNLRDRFPHPYTREDAHAFIEMARSSDRETHFCIAVDGEAAGSIGFTPRDDVERFTAEVGYWLGERYWGRGIVTEALTSVTAYALREHGLYRLFAVPFAWNAASLRVLEKAGYTREGRMRCSAYKDGQVVDQILYAFTSDGPFQSDRP